MLSELIEKLPSGCDGELEAGKTLPQSCLQHRAGCPLGLGRAGGSGIAPHPMAPHPIGTMGFHQAGQHHEHSAAIW